MDADAERKLIDSVLTSAPRRVEIAFNAYVQKAEALQRLASTNFVDARIKLTEARDLAKNELADALWEATLSIEVGGERQSEALRDLKSLAMAIKPRGMVKG